MPVILGAITLAKSSFARVHEQLVIDRSCGMDDSANRPSAVSDVLAQPGRHLVDVGDIDTGGGDSDTEAFDRPDRGDGREVGIVLGQLRPTCLWAGWRFGSAV